MRIYRVEARDGHGPYTTVENMKLWMGDVPGAMMRHTPLAGRPGPGDEEWPPNAEERRRRMQMSTDKARFGFPSKRALLKWFDDPQEIERLSRIGYHVAVYETDKVITATTRRQVVFCRPSTRDRLAFLTWQDFKSKPIHKLLPVPQGNST